MEHVVVLIAEVRDQIFDFGRPWAAIELAVLVVRHPFLLDHHALWSEKIRVVAIVELLGVIEVNLKDEAFGAVCRLVCNGVRQSFTVLYPLEATRGEGLRHRPPVEVIGVQVLDVGGGLPGVVLRNQGVIGPGKPEGCHRDASVHPLLYEEVLVVISQQLEFRSCLLEKDVSREPGACVVVGGVQPVLLHAGFPEGFCPAIQVAVVTEGPAPERLPYLLRMGVVLIANVAIEALLGGDMSRIDLVSKNLLANH